eukprot:3754287-Rhodomonas_salina.1
MGGVLPAAASHSRWTASLSTPVTLKLVGAFMYGPRGTSRTGCAFGQRTNDRLRRSELHQCPTLLVQRVI